MNDFGEAELLSNRKKDDHRSTIKNLGNWFGLVLFVFTVLTLTSSQQIFKKSIEYDESTSLLFTAGTSSPAWPEYIVNAGKLKDIFKPSLDFIKITKILKKTQAHPPLYFLLLAVWRKIFGNGIETARFFSFLCTGGAAIILVGIINSAVRSNILTLTTIIFFLFSQMSVFMATTARPYALPLFLLLCAVLTIYVAYSDKKHNMSKFKTILYITSGFLAGLAILSNHFVAISIFLLGLWMMIISISSQNWKIVVYFLIGATLPCLVEIWMLPNQIRLHSSIYVGFLGLSEFSKDIKYIFNTVTPFGFYDLIFRFQSISLYILIFIIFLSSFFIYTDIKNNPRNKFFWMLMLLLSFGFIFCLDIFELFMNKNINKYRYFFLVSPFFAFFVSLGSCIKVKKFHVGLVFIIPILLVQFYWVIFEQNKYSNTGEEWRDLSSIVTRLPKSETLILIDTGYGRGVPASMVYELPDNSKIRMVTAKTNLMRLVKEITPYRYVVMVMSRQKQGIVRMHDFKEVLLSLGMYHQNTILLNRHPLLEKTPF